MDKRDRIAYATFFVAFLEILVIIIIAILFNLFKLDADKLKEVFQPMTEGAQEVVNEQLKIINEQQKDIEIDRIAKKSEKEFNSWNKKNNTDFIFPIDFGIKNDDLKINYNAEFNEDFHKIDAKVAGFPLGEYNFPESPIGQMVLSNVQRQINDFLLENGNNATIKIKAIGTADGTKPNPNIKYNGDFGDNIEIPYFDVDKPTNKPITKKIKKGQEMTNNEYALFRAYSVVNYFKKNTIAEINKDNIRIEIKLYKEEGPEYRYCGFSVMLEKYFKYQLSDKYRH